MKYVLIIGFCLCFFNSFGQCYDSGVRYFGPFNNNAHQRKNLILINRIFGTNYQSWNEYINNEPNPGWINGEFLEAYDNVQACNGIVCNVNNLNHNGCLHKGIDYRASIGTNVFSPISGVVRKAGNDAFGTLAIFNETLNKTVLFLHLSSVEVKVGDLITVGQLLAQTGDKGVAGSPHLHLELRQGDLASGQCLNNTATTNYDPRILVEVINFAQQISRGNATTAQAVSLIFRNLTGLVVSENNTITNLRIGENIINQLNITQRQSIGNNYYLVNVNIPAGTLQNSNLYDIRFDLNLNQNGQIITIADYAYGSQQLLCSNSNFSDNSNLWYVPYRVIA